MRKLNSFIVGWVDTNIATLAKTGFLSPFGSVLITSIDSMTDLLRAAIRTRIAEVDRGWTSLGSGIVVRGQSIVALAREFNVFTGFDELWCFDGVPSKPIPSDLGIVAPLNLETEPAPPNLAAWMIETGCKLGLGDGIGLNYVTADEKLAMAIQRLVA